MLLNAEDYIFINHGFLNIKLKDINLILVEKC
jgi:hypothetical protein